MSAQHHKAERNGRIRRAVVPCLLTIAPLVLLAITQIAIAPHTVEVVGRMDPQVDVWAVKQWRDGILQGHAIIAALLVGYWLCCAALGRSGFVQVRIANVVLASAGMIFAAGMAIALLVHVPHGLKAVCPVIGLRDTYEQLDENFVCFDCMTQCELFLYRAVPTLFLLLPMALLFLSAILRIVRSRRHA